jgi:hypothetical protein
MRTQLGLRIRERAHPFLLGSLLVCLTGSAGALIPLDPVPMYTSLPNGHYATGGAWVDVDGDGWLDMVVSNGNDMARQSLVVYHNNGDGTFPANPSWNASDIDYHGHLDVGDINGDGLPDVAVAVYIGPAGFSAPGRVKVYLNNGLGAFSSLPDWVSGENFYCFSVALGDADGDGDLDLACACGDDYYGHNEQQRIFFNTGGVLASLPAWRSTESGFALDVFWGDVDADGDLDVAFCGSSTPMRMYRNAQTTGGGIATTATWESVDLPEYGNTTAFGDWNGDGFPELAVADNNQLGGSGRFKVYANSSGALGTTPAWQSSDGGYGSHVSWVDLDLDGLPELAAGRWWGPAMVYDNTGGTLGTSPAWQSSTSSVIENMFWGDVDNDGLRPNGVTIASGNGARTLFPIGHSPVRSIDAVLVDGLPLPTSAYTFHLANGWVSLADPAPAGTGNVAIHFAYSVDLDLGVTNWDSNVGNYIFRNTSSAAVEEGDFAANTFDAFPNPAGARTWLRYQGPPIADARVTVHDATGRLVRELGRGPAGGGLTIWEWDGRDTGGRKIAGGVYFARLTGGHSAEARMVRLVVLR